MTKNEQLKRFIKFTIQKIYYRIKKQIQKPDRINLAFWK